jgi:glycosyltransferase involved in cell wall biosynthesis
MSLSIVIPIYNEEENIQPLYDRLRNTIVENNLFPAELIFVDDGCKDRSLEKVRGLNPQEGISIRLIELSRNFGHQIAVTAGLDQSIGEHVVIIDADLQDPPELIPELLRKIKDGNDVVYARRRNRKGESWLKKATAKWFYRLLARITNVPIPVDTGDFRVITRRVADVLNQMPEREKFLRGQIAWIGFDQTYVEYDRDERHGGDTGYTWGRMIGFALDGITSFSNFPLKVATVSGFVMSFISFLLMLYALYSRFVLKIYEPGWTSLMLSVLFIGGIQLVSIGIIGEYIGRIAGNVRNRPTYVVKNKTDVKAPPRSQ